jgi:hypothetical protein
MSCFWRSVFGRFHNPQPSQFSITNPKRMDERNAKVIWWIFKSWIYIDFLWCTVYWLYTDSIKGTQAWNFFILFFQKPKPYGPKGLKHEIFENCIWFSGDIRLLNISTHAQHAMKLVPRMLSIRWNSFRVCSVCNKIRSAYAEHVLYM